MTQDIPKCPKCGGEIIGVEYGWDHPFHYDGISEWMCASEPCKFRWGRWTGKELKKGEYERPFGKSE